MADTVGVSTVQGGIFDVSLASGALRVDAARNAEAYGAGVAPAAILDGTVDPPPEMQARVGAAGACRLCTRSSDSLPFLACCTAPVVPCYAAGLPLPAAARGAHRRHQRPPCSLPPLAPCAAAAAVC